jgi:hypothetical protein
LKQDSIHESCFYKQDVVRKAWRRTGLKQKGGIR